MSSQSTPASFNHQKRYLRATYTLMALAYVLIGAVLIIEQKVRSRIPYFTDWPNSSEMQSVPSGSSDQDVTAYYSYLHSWSLSQVKETYFFNPLLLTWVYATIGVIIIIFIFLSNAWYARYRQGDLYPVEVYNGYMSERGGKVEYFNWAVYIILGAFMVYYAATNLIYGQIY
ncbi:MAG: hypothetical protein ACYC6B_08655 [Thermoleophilia bacterium]